MIYLLRHPQSEANVKNISGGLDTNLTDRGKWQATKTAERLSTYKIPLILSSPALRCKYLAEEINKYHEVEIKILDELRERDYGTLINKSGTHIFKLGPDERPENGESVLDVYKRSLNFLRTTNIKEETLIVSHGLFLKMLSANILGLDYIHASKMLKFSNCALNCIDNNHIEFMNDRTHLGNTIKKIHIFGGWASGKTSLGKNLSKILDIPIYHLDEIKYETQFTNIRPVQERLDILEEITKKDTWITEGAWTSYANNSFERSDFLIYCDVEKKIALNQAKKRQEQRNTIQGASLTELLRAINNYYETNDEVSKKTHDSLFEKNITKSKRLQEIDLTILKFPEDLW